MSCCGTSQAPMTDRHRIKVRYLGGRPIEITGPATGTVYRFSGKAPLQLVDPRDAVQMSRSRGFRVEGMVKLNDESQEGENHG
jgi:hypothetical protein